MTPTNAPHIEYGFEVVRKGQHPSLYKQVHGATLIAITGEPSAPPPEADGAYTFDSQRELYVFTADCLPALIYSEDPYGPIATVHCGWRGAKGRILEKALQVLGPITSLGIILGPAILSCCFEVKQDFIDELTDAGHVPTPYLHTRGEKRFFDLIAFVRETQLASLADFQIDGQHVRCTVCSSPTLPSYRRDRNTDPRIRSWIKKRSAAS